MGIFRKKEAKSENEKILEAKDFCEKFKKNPVGSLVMPIICIVVIAFTTDTVWSHAFVDFHLLFSSDSGITSFFFIFAMTTIFYEAINYFRGSKNDPDKTLLRAVGTFQVIIALLTAFIAACCTNKYSWIESEAMESINKKVLCGSDIKSTGVQIYSNTKDTYFGLASLFDGTTVPVTATYKLLRWHRHGIIYKVSAELEGTIQKSHYH